MPAPERLAFGDFVLQRSQQRVLLRDGSELGLTPRLFGALQLFVDHPDTLLDKDRLMQALWPGLVVEENNLSQTISALRRALGDEPAGRRYIQTVARRGYRFIAPVTALDDAEPPPAAMPAVAEPVDRPSRRLALAGAAVAAAAALAAAAFWRAGSGPPARATLAVLPFKPLAADSRDELLELGMADSLITRLSLVPGLVVRSVASVRRYAGNEQDPVRAARDLDVDWIVDGSLQRRGDQLRVNARLLRASDGSASWSDSFDAQFTGVFDMQDQISARVLQALAPRLRAAGVAQGLPDKPLGGTRSTQAYELYLAATRHAQPRRGDSLRKSITLFREALAVDPGYAMAHVGLAEALRETLLAADAAPADVFEPARQAVQRALALAPDLAEALSEQGFSRYYFDFDWPGAEQRFRRALAVNPNVAMAHFGLAQLLLTQDRPDEGMRHLRLARELDPMSAFLNALEAGYLLARGERDAARLRLQRALDIAPDFYLAHRTQALLHLADGRNDLALTELRQMAAGAGGNSRPQALLGMHLARLGHTAEARAILDRLLQRASRGYVPPISLAVLHAALGETALALDALERAHAAHDTQLVFLKDDPRWAPLRGQPRFIALLRQLKLDRYGPGLSPT
ncbi:TolB-like protein/DNA-binding winged helix-turn-helix (wHTH) protein/Tfp pilus assembly protein PilF [Pelomonas aquatica]|uniref:TolB-like protein/DNA-binding winged helix-turn-helix (WHTH) protein/Tfp pilus assembly protein PilF n=1 Tax=Pelomonas aquatica TaxID=431058 RepID=A0ABU1ZE17_9BURK|nr:winged helix-turn-helix domain-containing protein [Pelomonas aquatica]MDR7298291.1 TolB-like protein/DNA-binding winged helix-turn-helix (wHTH) protein/Tfp pilus assembly protein PilF [Pelomonas aquatica]